MKVVLPICEFGSRIGVMCSIILKRRCNHHGLAYSNHKLTLSEEDSIIIF